jgi:hypothetical protein
MSVRIFVIDYMWVLFVPFLILIFQKDQILPLSMRRVYHDRTDGGSEIGYYFPNLYQLFQ